MRWYQRRKIGLRWYQRRKNRPEMVAETVRQGTV